MNEAAQEALRRELLDIVAASTPGTGMSAHAVHAQASLSPDLPTTLGYLKQLRDAGQVDKSNGMYYSKMPRGAARLTQRRPAAQQPVQSPPPAAPLVAHEPPADPVEVPFESQQNNPPQQEPADAGAGDDMKTKGNLQERILEALPATGAELEKRLKLKKTQVQQTIFLLKKRGEVTKGDDGVFARVGGKSSRGGASPAKRKPPAASDVRYAPTADVVLVDAAERAQSALDEYVAATCDPDILGALRQACDGTRLALETYRAKHPA